MQYLEDFTHHSHRHLTDEQYVLAATEETLRRTVECRDMSAGDLRAVALRLLPRLHVDRVSDGSRCEGQPAFQRFIRVVDAAGNLRQDATLIDLIGEESAGS